MNPYRDPKSGRFTTGGNVGAGLEGQAGLVRSIKGPRVKGTIPTGQGPKYKEQKGGEMSKILRGSVRTMHQQEQNRLYRAGGNVAGSRLIRAGLRKGAEKLKAQAKSRNIKADPNTKLSDVLRGTLRNLAQSDARRLRAIDAALKESRSVSDGSMIGSTKIPKTRRLKGK